MINSDAHIDLRRFAKLELDGSSEPVSIVDIGSNSVRLVVYEGGSCVPNVVFNEKVQAALGAEVAATGAISAQAMERVSAALKRFAFMASQAGSKSLYALATAATREASNGPEFVAMANDILGCEIKVLSGQEEAQFAALGVDLGFDQPAGVVGDMGGGSLELVHLNNGQFSGEVTTPMGGLRLSHDAQGDPQKAKKIARKLLKNLDALETGKGEEFFAVGGSWRNLASLHMAQTNHPLRIIHNYEVDAGEARDFCKILMTEPLEKLAGFEAISASRRPLMPICAAVMSEIIKAMDAKTVRFSAFGVREGYLYNLGKVAPRTQKHAPFLDGVFQFAKQRSRSSDYALELCDWTDRMFVALQLDESDNERYLRWAGCMLADISWKAHPDYRGRQSLNILAHGQFVGLEHKARAFMALVAYYRNDGVREGEVSDALVALAGARLAHRAQILGALLRLSYSLSASLPGVLDEIDVQTDEDDRLQICIPSRFEALMGERPKRRTKQLREILQREISLSLTL